MGDFNQLSSLIRVTKGNINPQYISIKQTCFSHFFDKQSIKAVWYPMKLSTTIVFKWWFELLFVKT